MSGVLRWVAVILVLGAVGAVLLPPLGVGRSPQTGERGTAAELLRRGAGETGSINLVSGIYLGYRAFDTLGETIVLVLSVAGVIAVSGARK